MHPIVYVFLYRLKEINTKIILYNNFIFKKYLERNAGAVIHVHSLEAVKLCLLTPEKELRISDLEMIKVSYHVIYKNCIDKFI